MHEHISVDVRDGVQTIRFDRAEFGNALTGEMFDLAADAVSLAERNTSVRAVVVAGMPGMFTTGHDPAELQRFAEQAEDDHQRAQLVGLLGGLIGHDSSMHVSA